MTNENHFVTQRLPLAIFLHATQRLPLSRCELVGDKVQFVFSDPQGIGDQAELDFENGESVVAKALLASQTFLRRRMSDALNQNRNDNRKDENRKNEHAYSRR
jgi:hypothetical protein